MVKSKDKEFMFGFRIKRKKKEKFMPESSKTIKLTEREKLEWKTVNLIS